MSVTNQRCINQADTCRGVSKVPLYDCIQSLQLKFLLMIICRNVMRGSGERAIIGPSAKCHLNGVLLVGQF